MPLKFISLYETVNEIKVWSFRATLLRVQFASKQNNLILTVEHSV